MVLLQVGCNNSRYGIHYDQRLPELKRIAVAPASIQVFSLHAGGLKELRPDMERPARDQALDSAACELSKRHVDTFIIRQPTSAPTIPTTGTGPHALVNAVHDSILIHHYRFGNERMLDYSVGNSAQSILAGQQADAVLWVYLIGVVPTGGREALKATAIVVGVLTGLPMRVSTNDAVIMLMLVDSRTGDVLWFNQAKASKAVRQHHAIKRLMESASKYLLKPRK
jgi:hypothetical protein